MRSRDAYRHTIEAPAFEMGVLLDQALALLDETQRAQCLEPLLKQALDLGASSAGNLGSFGQLLLSAGRRQDGLDLVRRALRQAAASRRPNRALLAELMFYLFAHDRPNASHALATLKSLIRAGVRTDNWNFEANITRAQDEGHPEIALLRDLGKVLSHGAAPSLLESHVAWRLAG